MRRVSFSFLAIGKTKESTEATESKQYVGVASSFVLAVNPTKAELEKIYGREIPNEPEYINPTKEVDNIRVDFIVKTDPVVNDGIEAINKVSFFLQNEPSYNKDKTKVQVIDEYGNSTWGLVEDVKMNKKLLTTSGKEAKIAPKYRMAFSGEADLVDFLKIYLNMDDVFDYKNGSWVMKEGNTDDYKFSLEHIKDYFKGNVSEIKEAVALMPKNKVKLLYGVRTTDKGQFQSIISRNGMILRNNANSSALARLAKLIADTKSRGYMLDTALEVCPLKEYKVKATDLETVPATQSAVPSEDTEDPIGFGNTPWE